MGIRCYSNSRQDKTMTLPTNANKYEFQQLYSGTPEETMEKFNANFERLFQQLDAPTTSTSGGDSAVYDLIDNRNSSGTLDFNQVVNISGLTYASGSFTMTKGLWNISGVLSAFYRMSGASEGNSIAYTYSDVLNGVTNKVLASRGVGIGTGMGNKIIFLKAPINIYRNFKDGDIFSIRYDISNLYGQAVTTFNYSTGGLGSSALWANTVNIGPEGLMFTKLS
jgi:hypothetical protein